MAATPPPSPSGLPILGQTLDFTRDTLAFHDNIVAEYGDVVQVKVLGVGEYYILAHPDHFKHVLVDSPERFAKTADFEIAFGDSVLTNQGERWERQRSALKEFFYPERIRSYAETMVTLTNRRINRWTAGEVVSLRDEMKGAAIDNLFGTLFDQQLNPDGDEHLRQAANDLNLWFKSTSYALPRWVPTPSRRRFHKGVRRLKSEARSLLAACDPDRTGDDLLSTLVDLRETDKNSLSDEEIVDQLITLIFAGHDTTALTLTAALHQLGTHETIRNRFHAELDAVLGGDPPTVADIGDLAFTERIVHETLRKYPPVHTLPRKTTQTVILDGHRLQAGMRTHLSIWHVHRDNRFWENPHEFRPTRWCDTPPQAKGYAFVPFGGGPRTCLGRRFALLEAILVLATVGQRYHLAPECELTLTPEMTIQPAHRVPARVHYRE